MFNPFKKQPSTEDAQSMMESVQNVLKSTGADSEEAMKAFNQMFHNMNNLLCSTDGMEQEDADALLEAVGMPLERNHVVECPGCGASNQVKACQSNKCEYCGRSLD